MELNAQDEQIELILQMFQRGNVALLKIIDLRHQLDTIELVSQIQRAHGRYGILFDAVFIQHDESLAIRQYLIRYNLLDAVIDWDDQSKATTLLILNHHKQHFISSGTAAYFIKLSITGKHCQCLSIILCTNLYRQGVQLTSVLCRPV